MAYDKNTLLLAVDAGLIDENLQAKLDEQFAKTIVAHDMDSCSEAFDKEQIDLVVFHLDSETISTKELLDLFRAKVDKLPALGISEKTDDDLDKAMRGIRLDGVIQPPLDIDKLNQRLTPLESRVEKLFKERVAAKPKDDLPERSLSIDESIDVYFKKTMHDLAKFAGVNRIKSVNFDVMRTFLYTAFNNFKEIDPAFEDEKLKISKQNLEFATKMQNDLNKRLGYAIEAHYENIFLKKQIPYLKIYRESEEVKTKMEEIRAELGILTSQQADLKEKIKHLRKGSDTFTQMQQDLKRINGKHTDRVHQLRELMDRIGELVEEKEAFWKEHLDAFKEKFVAHSEDIKAEVTKTLDALAYIFDQQLWRQAKKSRNIREFFAQSRVHGLFSSKTYLEYYVGNLDEKLVGENSKKLIRYMKEINQTNRISIAVLSTDYDEVAFFREVLDKIDNSIKTFGYSHPDMLIKNMEKEQFEIIIMEFSLGKVSALNFIEKFREKFPEESKSITFCIIFPDYAQKKFYSAALNMGIKNFFKKGIGREQLTEYMLRIL